MGSVYRARQIALDRPVAIKVMHRQLEQDAAYAARFDREAKAASRLDHPSLIRVLDFGREPDGPFYIAMEFLDGRDLYRVLAEDWPLSPARIIDILSQTLAGLAAAHDAGVLHRDLKPENIMLLRRRADDGTSVDLVRWSRKKCRSRRNEEGSRACSWRRSARASPPLTRILELVSDVTWVLIRGLARETGHFGDFVDLLAKKIPRAQILPLDLPGTGTRLHEKSPQKMREIVQHVRDEANAKKNAGTPLFLFGMSLGGMVVMEWAKNHPGELAGIVVGCSSARDLSTRFQRFSPRGVLAVGMNRFLTRDPVAREARMVRLLSYERGHYERTVKIWGDIAIRRPIPPETVRSQVIAAMRWRAPAHLQTPALFLVGSKDRLVDPRCTHALAKRFGTKAVVHERAGHDLTADQGDWCASEIFSFQKNVLSKAAAL